jgi:hypothetical protein
VVLALAALAAAFAPAAQAGAAAVPTPASCQAYPIGAVPAATLSVSTTTPFPGESITVSGTNFEPHDAITIVLSSNLIELGHVTTNASGAFSTSVTIPSNLSGSHVLSLVGAVAVCQPSPITLTIQGEGTSGGGLPNTGVDILAGIAIALALLTAGVALTRGGRRRQHSSH